MSLLLFSLIILYISVCLAKVENLVVFGDSYSDVGNVQQNSNGPLWSENLAVAWNASLYSFAFSGSTCDDSNKMTSTAPSIVDQIEMYYNQQLNLEPENTVYAFWIGYSDLHNMIKKNDKEYDKVLDCLMQQVANVRKVFGTNRFILFTLAPMDKMPYFSKDESESEKRKEAVDTFNQLLHEKFLNLVKYHNTLELDLVDVHDLLVDMIDSPAEFGFSEGDQAYWDACQGKCLDAIDDYIWWDKLHLTGGAHRAITTSILMSNSLEPSVTLPSSTTIHDLLNQPDSQFKSPIYEASYHTGLIDKVLKKLKDVKEKETTKEKENEKQENVNVDENEYYQDKNNDHGKKKLEKGKQYNDQLEEKEKEKIDDNDYKELADMETSKDPWIRPLYFFGFLTVLVCLGVVLFSRQSRRRNGNNLAALSGLVKNRNNTRGRFTPLRNLDSSV